MEYNYIKIGERLKKERKEYGFKSHDALCEYIKENNYRSFKRQTISKWEQGKECPPLDVLLTLCKLYNCELGYLLCEYDCKIKENSDIQKITGLSEKNIEYLKDKKKKNPKYINSINLLLSSDNFDNTLYYLTKYIKASKLFLGLNQIRTERRNNIFSSPPPGANGSYNYPYNDSLEKSYKNAEQDMLVTEYELDTHFRYIIQEIYRKNSDAI